MKRKRKNYLQRIRRLRTPRQGKPVQGRVIFVDEFGTNTAMTPSHGYAPKGERAHGSAPVNHGGNVTLVMGLSEQGVVAPFAFPGAMDGNAFVHYVRFQLAPHLRPGDVVVVDNLSAHKNTEARALVKMRGASVVDLAPYSPDLSPVEECGAKVKMAVRKQEPRTVAEVYVAMGVAIGTVTGKDARGWFDHRASYLPRPPN